MSAGRIRIALVGSGKIARDQHVPAIRGSDAFVLGATAGPCAGVEGVAHHDSLSALLAAGGTPDAVAICTPPQVRHDLAAEAIAHGLHVLLEKPPGCTLSEVAALERRASRAGTTLFAAWHSRFAAGVEPARAWLAGRQVRRAAIVWHEDVRAWHPGQAWIWEAGGMGVFDPGINALSIATRILPGPLRLADASLSFPANRAAPIAARLALRDAHGAELSVDLDWRQQGSPRWDVAVETDAGELTLSAGGASLVRPGSAQSGQDREYPRLYARFAELVRSGASEVDVEPLRLVADAFLRGRRETVEDFHD